MREGSLEAPIRHPIDWQNEDFYNRESLDKELRHAFDICHGCRRCFNLCDSFPTLFDLVDDSETGELDSVSSAEFGQVIDGCTLCDMCFLTKCPYVPPHEFNLDFPHLMLRARAVEAREKGIPFAQKQLTKTDRNGKLAGKIAPLANWASKCGNHLTRPALEKVAGVHRDAELPEFHSKTLVDQAEKHSVEINKAAPAFGRKVVIYATCFSNYNNPDIGMAARAVLAHNGVEVETVYPECCGMPQLEHGDLGDVAGKAERVASVMGEWIDRGYDVIALVPSCALMLKFEWPLISPDNTAVKKLAEATFDITEYIVDIAKKNGMADGLAPLEGGVTAHIACHARAQNMGQKATEMLKLVPDTQLNVIERCSGHGGSWGIMKDNYETAHKVGKPAARKIAENVTRFVVSECPLARDHLVSGAKRLDGDLSAVETLQHPIQLIARSYGLET